MQVSDQQKFLRSGLSKLAEAEETVDSLSQGADKQRALLKVKQAEAEQALGYIQESMMKVEMGGSVLPSPTPAHMRSHIYGHTLPLPHIRPPPPPFRPQTAARRLRF